MQAPFASTKPSAQVPHTESAGPLHVSAVQFEIAVHGRQVVAFAKAPTPQSQV